MNVSLKELYNEKKKQERFLENFQNILICI